MVTLQLICDWIVLIAAVLAAIVTIVNFFRKPTKAYKNKKHKEIQTIVKEELNETLPKMFEEHDLATRDKYLADRMRYLTEIKNEVANEMKDVLLEIKAINERQSSLIEKINQSSKDVLRQKIMAIYFKGREHKQMSVYDHEALIELYKDYKSQGGNSYIDKYYNRMETWEIIDEDADYIV
jgi:outer membrane protein assembly factor BamA